LKEKVPNQFLGDIPWGCTTRGDEETMRRLLNTIRQNLRNRQGMVGLPLCRDKKPLDASDSEFIEMAYQILLRRRPDTSGFHFYFEKLSKGEMSREDFILSLIQSEEFEKRHNLSALHEFFLDAVIAGSSEAFSPFVKKVPFKDVQLNELTNPFKWINSEWRQLGNDLKVVPMSLQGMHRKAFEWVQAIYGLSLQRKIHHNSIAMGVGTGHECIVYWLAKHLKNVFATDLFRGDWTSAGSTEGDPSVLKNPEKYQPFDYPTDRLQFLPMNGCHLAWKDNSFDIVFSLSSIEHFGGKDSAAQAMEEICRVLKPGGSAVIATEFILNQKRHPEFFDEADLLNYIVKPSKLKLIQDISFKIPRIFLEKPNQFPSEIYKTPSLSLSDGNIIWTSIILFFEKPSSSIT
jgi:SAM-dependent methyltransferase